MKILLLAKAYPPETGGVETYSEQVAQAYAHAGHDVTVLTTHPGPVGTERRAGVSVCNVGQHGSQPRIFARMIRRLRSLQPDGFDVVHATTWRVALPVLLMRLRQPLVVTMHGREVFVVPRPLRPVMRRVLTRADHLPTVSRPILDLVRDTLGLKLTTAFPDWNGISFLDESRVPHQKPDRIEIVSICRLVERKNMQGAIRAVAALIGKGYDLRFRIAGSGETADDLHGLIEDLGMGERIRMLGRVPDDAIVPLYRSSHVFLHPQIATRDGRDMEGFGLTIADAMSFGCVPVAGASGGPADFIRHGETGFLVDGTRQADIDAALEALVADPATIAVMGARARDFAHRELTWRSHVDTILAKVGAVSA